MVSHMNNELKNTLSSFEVLIIYIYIYSNIKLLLGEQFNAFKYVRLPV